jgi:hypothetical protein
LEDPVLNYMPDGSLNPDRKKRRPPSLIQRKKVWTSGPRWGGTKRPRVTSDDDEGTDGIEEEEWEQVRAYEGRADDGDDEDLRIEDDEAEDDEGQGKEKEAPRQIAYL